MVSDEWGMRMKRFFMALFIALSVVSVAPIMQATESHPCGICLKELVNGTDVVGLECGHSFHAGCIIILHKGYEGDAACPDCGSDLRHRGESGERRLFENLDKKEPKKTAVTWDNAACCTLGLGIGAVGVVVIELGAIMALITPTGR